MSVGSVGSLLYWVQNFFVFIHNVWKEKRLCVVLFWEDVVPGKAGCKATCRACGKTMQGLVARMKQHHEGCVGAQNRGDTTDTSDAEISLPSPRKRATSPAPILPKKKTCYLDEFVMQTSGKDKSAIDHQLAKMIYATNSPFSLVDHPEFTKLMSLFRPGYRPPTRYDVGGRFLDEVHTSMLTSMLSDCKDQHGGETVSMALDGWSNVHNKTDSLCIGYFGDQARVS